MDDTFSLLPFRFIRINDNKELIVNDLGDYLILEPGTVKRIVKKEIKKNEIVYKDLLANHFIYSTPNPELLEIIATRYRTKKAFLNEFTSLHIFVLTLRCNHSCSYCQVSQRSENAADFDMSYEDIDSAISLMFKTPSKHITIEFQGGEPLLVFDKIKYTIDKILLQNFEYQKTLTFVICTNLTMIQKEQLEYCKENTIMISTSLDGPERLHNSNRIMKDGNSYKKTIKGIKLCQKILGTDYISPLLTTSRQSLSHAQSIIDHYRSLGFSSIFLRPLNPYGLALKNESKLKYDIDEFLTFYKEAFDYILYLNKNGLFFVEEYAAIILTKILTPYSSGFTDLQSPNGLINSTIVYNYDGFVYASDESRMLAEQNDTRFQLGKIQDSYENIVLTEKVLNISKIWMNESLPGCSDCVFQPYCGTDPVRNYVVQGDMAGRRPTSDFCKKNRSVFTYLFNLIDQDGLALKVFYSWIYNLRL